MKKLCGLVVFCCTRACIVRAGALHEVHLARHLIRVKPTHMDDYLTMLRQTTKSVYEENKKQVPSSTTRSSSRRPRTARDWDICIAVEYKTTPP